MFRHGGKTRTFSHNVKIASLLSFVAGMVNVTGFLAVQKLTTNVTGHFAFFVDEVFQLNVWEGFLYFLYIFFFFLGSFIAGLLVELLARKGVRHIYAVPVLLECMVLTLIGMIPTYEIGLHPNIIAFGLLFSMGLQNSLVTTISNATVRTTHLTGLFTDLGIELSQLFFYQEKEPRKKLFNSIKLRLTIISFFFLGGILGGILYTAITIHSLIICSVLLIGGLVYDRVKLEVISMKRNAKSISAKEAGF